MKHIVVSGYYGSRNAGDEAMLAAMLEVWAEMGGELQITVISANPADTRQRHGVDSIGLLDFKAIWRALKRADLLVSGGGSLLQNVTSRRSLYYYMAILALARLAGTPAMLYAQGIGPITGFLARHIMRWIGNHVQRITVRDHGSLTELASMGIKKPPIKETADPVLAIRPASLARGRTILQEYTVREGEALIGISVREWKGWKGYKEAIAKAADILTKELKARIVFLPMQYPEDVRAAEGIAAQMQEQPILLDSEFTTAELLSIVGNMELLLAVRLHALIFAGVMGVPMVGISYDPKVDRFLDSIGEKSAGALQEVTAEAIVTDAKQKWQQREAFKKDNAARLRTLRRLAEENARIAIAVVEQSIN